MLNLETVTDPGTIMFSLLLKRIKVLSLNCLNANYLKVRDSCKELLRITSLQLHPTVCCRNLQTNHAVELLLKLKENKNSHHTHTECNPLKCLCERRIRRDSDNAKVLEDFDIRNQRCVGN